MKLGCKLLVGPVLVVAALWCFGADLEAGTRLSVADTATLPMIGQP